MSAPSRERGEGAPRDDHAEAWSHLRAAVAILRSPTAEPHHALVHLGRCCVALLEETETREMGPLPGGADQPSTVRASRDARVREIRARLMRWESGDAPAALPGRRELLAQAQDLAAWLRLPRAPARRTAWGWTAAVVAALALAAVAIPRWCQASRAVGPWQARYYPGADFAGRPLLRDEPDVSHRWGTDPPLPELPRDRFSARWESCLVLDHPLTIPWQLVARGSARLHVDGRSVLELPGDGTLSARGETITLDRGAHHVLVEYSAGAGDASIALLASLDGEPPKALPARWLRPPRGDGTTACVF